MFPAGQPEVYHHLIAQIAKKPMTPLQVERSILRRWTRENELNGCDMSHTDIYEFRDALGEWAPPMEVSGIMQHMIRYMRLTMPNVEINPWIIWMFQETAVCIYTHKRKVINFIGSKNSGKTNFFGIIANLLVSIDPEYSRAFISGPYKTAAEATVWGRVGTRSKDMVKSQRAAFSHVRDIPSAQKIIYDSAESEAGYIELVTLDKVGKLQGTKSKDPDRGWLVLECDEIGTFPTMAAKDALDNLTGNRNFICFTGCNFRNTEGLEGDLCRPKGREYSDLDTERDHTWLSGWNSYTVRLDGHRSPNILAGRQVSKYLLTEDVRADMEKVHGLNGPKYLEQIRSFPNMSMADNYVTTREKIRASGGFDDFIWDTNSFQTCAFCDPGFGGDPCKIGAFRFGTGRVQTLDGGWRNVSIFEPIEPFRTLKIDTKLIADEEWVRRLRAAAQDSVIISPGKLVTAEQQIAVQCHEYLSFHSIQRSHFGFDGSMRAGIVKEMVTVLGSQIHAIDFGGQATERIANKDGQTYRELYANFVTEMYFQIGDIAQMGQLRGADRIPAAIAQICRRPFKFSGPKKQIQTKSDFKEANQGKSPDDADTLVGGYEMARRLGFNELTVRNAVNSTTADVIEVLRGLPMFARFKAKSLSSL